MTHFKMSLKSSSPRENWINGREAVDHGGPACDYDDNHVIGRDLRQNIPCPVKSFQKCSN